MKIYLVGGAVRDELMGRPCNDMDYSCEVGSYQEMKDEILASGGKIWQEREEFLTIRARMPDLGDADFVMCRKDGQYFDGRHPETVEPGTILDDLARRDFTMNAIAKDVETGGLIDPHGGQADIKSNVIFCVGNPEERFREDQLRMVRALRFSISLNMMLSMRLKESLSNPELLLLLSRDIPADRIRQEAHKMFHADTDLALRVLEEFSGMRSVMFNGHKGIWLKPTTEK
tara:strand:+ start:907 stop:1596 length:690 start_codon:yes stop_codon:yes gene_type:complete